ncbi:MAG: cache domain-containing protein [Candidatus Omnitrophica bacterium]|nr:cache domain-containing protein [Candidatus Omnitrophota bacterium]
MKAASLRTKILISLLSIVFFLGISLGLFGYYIVKKYIVGKAQEQIVYDLQTVRKTYQRQHENMKDIFSLLEPDFDLNFIKDKMGLDYIFVVNAEDLSSINSELAKESFHRKSAVSSSRIISEQELKEIGEELYSRALVSVKYTPKSRPDIQDFLKSAMSLEAARPFLDQRNEVTKIVYGGKIINNNLALIDEISDTVFKTDPHQSKGSGTVTIFLDGVRIATNVLDNKHQRAIGTVVSEVVYNAVVENSGEWLDRAFVVTDWYLTAYEPIVNLKGEVIGILYVGIPEKPFYDIGRNFFLILVLILAAASLTGILLSCLLSLAITKPVREVLRGTERLSYGDTDTVLKTDTSIKELNDLAASFNIMAGKLKVREESLEVSNEKLASLNKSYLDLIGFVAHELKGILASAILNVYSVKDGFLGLTNFKQRKALDSVAKNLDYLSQTVKTFSILAG